MNKRYLDICKSESSSNINEETKSFSVSPDSKIHEKSTNKNSPLTKTLSNVDQFVDTPQKKICDAGNLYISILNQEKTKELFNLLYKSNENFSGQSLQQKCMNRAFPERRKELKGVVKIKLFEDYQGHRSYELILDLPENSKMNSKKTIEGTEYHLQTETSECFLKINSKKTDNEKKTGNLIGKRLKKFSHSMDFNNNKESII